MPDEPSQSFFSNLKNLFSLNKNTEETAKHLEPEDERIEELIENVLNIKDSVVKEIMIPKVSISYITESDSLEHIYSVVNDTKHSRYPVFNSEKDKVIGILHVKDILGALKKDDFSLGSILREAFIIMDEGQNTTIEQMKMFLTRLGFRSKAVVNGDLSQIDLPKSSVSGLKHAIEVLKDVESIKFTKFTARDVVRHSLVQEIVEAYDNFE